MGEYGVLTSAPSAAVREGSVATRMGQALQFLPKLDVESGSKLRLVVSHNRHRIRFVHADMPTEPPRRGLMVSYQYHASLDGHNNRTMAAALRKAIFSYPKTRNLLIVHVGSGFGTLSIVAAAARPDVDDHVVACEKSADLLAVAEAAARDNHVSGRISFLQKDARNLKAHDDLVTKADVCILECIDYTLIGDGVLHYVAHLRGSYLKDSCRLIPAAGVMKGMLVQLRTGEIHGVDMTMCDAYRWAKVAPMHARAHCVTRVQPLHSPLRSAQPHSPPNRQAELRQSPSGSRTCPPTSGVRRKYARSTCVTRTIRS